MSVATVMFLDDDRYEMLGFVEKLESAGFRVSYFTAQEDALKALGEGASPDLIISDLIMRGDPEAEPMDNRHVGIKFCRAVREEMNVSCPIVVLTVIADPALHADALRFADSLLVKPVTPKELLDRVKEVLRR